MSSSPLRILYIAEGRKDVSSVERRLGSFSDFKGHIHTVHGTEAGVKHLSRESEKVDLILCDLGSGDKLGPVMDLRKVCEDVPIIVLLDKAPSSSLRQLMPDRVQDYLLKAELTGDMLMRSVRYATAMFNGEMRHREGAQQLQSLISNIPGAVCRFIPDAERTLVFASKMLEQITGFPAADFLQNKVRSYDSIIYPEDAADMAERFKAAMASGTAYNHMYRIDHADGQIRWVREKGRFIRDGRGKVKWLDVVLMDVTERAQAHQKLNHLVYHDALTHLPNRLLFQDRMKQAIRQAKFDGYFVGLLFLGIDLFKRVNDSLGHAVGDQLLQEFAMRIKDRLYETDTVTRIAGDQFVMLLPKMERRENIDPVIQKVFSIFKEPFQIGGHELHMTCSVGVSFYPDHGMDGETLMKNANIALQHAKEQGRNGYRLYSNEMSHKKLARLQLEKHLHHALERDEFTLFYQPMIDLQSGKICGAEALIRWQHPQLGLVPPNDFIPLAEETGLIIQIGHWVIREACEQIQSWIKNGLPPIKVAVNISAHQFERAGLTRFIRHVLEDTGVDPHLLELELTEGVIMKNVEGTVKILKELKEMGTRLSIDDFGTGHSSLSYLKRFPIDTLKIDRSFIRDLATDTDDAMIAQTIISMARSMKLKVVAEGVETAEQLSFLKANQCDMVQGFYFSKPIPSEEFTGLYRKCQNQPFRRASVA